MEEFAPVAEIYEWSRSPTRRNRFLEGPFNLSFGDIFQGSNVCQSTTFPKDTLEIQAGKQEVWRNVCVLGREAGLLIGWLRKYQECNKTSD